MPTINGRACVVNGKPVDKVYSNGKQVYGRNLLVGTSSLENSYTQDFSTVPNWTGQQITVNAGDTFTYSIYFTNLKGSFVLGYWGYNSNKKYVGWFPSAHYFSTGKISFTSKIPSGVSYVTPHVVKLSDNFVCTAKEEKLEQGDIATPWTPAPEDVGIVVQSANGGKR